MQALEPLRRGLPRGALTLPSSAHATPPHYTAPHGLLSFLFFPRTRPNRPQGSAEASLRGWQGLWVPQEQALRCACGADTDEGAPGDTEDGGSEQGPEGRGRQGTISGLFRGGAGGT